MIKLKQRRLPSSLKQTTHECVYSVTYDKPMNIHTTPMALYILALMWRMEFPIVMFACSPWVTQCTHYSGSCSPKHRGGGGIKFHVFAHKPMSFIYKHHPHALKIYRTSKNKTSYIKAFESYRQTETQPKLLPQPLCGW